MESLFILRHGVAEDISEDGSDFSRKLTDEGIQKTQKLGEFVNSLKEKFDLIISSPYLRAKQTAEIFSSKLNYKVEIIIRDSLGCGCSVNEIANVLREYINYKNVLIVGHAPDLEYLLGKLIDGGRVKLKKGALAKINLNNSFSGELEYLITSRIVKGLT